MVEVVMGKSRVYEIAYLGLKMGIHQYEYHLDNQFLENMGYDDEEVSEVDVTVRLTFDKHEGFFQLNFDYDGNIMVACDRCADPLPLKVWEEYKLIIKLTNNENELDEESEEDDVVFIPRTVTIIDIAEYLYEYLLLSIPIQKVHATDENGNSMCNPAVLELLKQYEQNIEEINTSSIWKQIAKDN